MCWCSNTIYTWLLLLIARRSLSSFNHLRFASYCKRMYFLMCVQCTLRYHIKIHDRIFILRIPNTNNSRNIHKRTHQRWDWKISPKIRFLYTIIYKCFTQHVPRFDDSSTKRTNKTDEKKKKLKPQPKILHIMMMILQK